jgi:(E)-4-hydroxy-3-methyl-but-2-enyl pyrophosphate reductase
VDRAVRKARDLARTSGGKRVCTDGPLIHNRQMMEQLRAEGVVECPQPEALTDELLMIRAHGIPPDRRARLARMPVTLVDATCPDVARTQGLIRRYARKGFHTLVFGDAGHAEVTGLLGYTEGCGHVVSRGEDVQGLPDMDAVCLVSQSTQFTEDYEGIADAVRRRFPRVVVLDTICESTKSRQQELADVAGKADAIVVVGGAHSANTLRLVEIARRLRPTFHIETVDQLDPSKLRTFRTVALTAGASTPAFVLDAVRKALEAM